MRKRKRRQIKPRGIVEHNNQVTPGIVAARQIESFSIHAWCPDNQAKEPPEQVHFVLNVKGSPLPHILRFKSPDTIGFLIEELTEYRRIVWPEAEPITGETNNK